MELTLNGIPVTIDTIAAQEIVRRHLQNGEDPGFAADLAEWRKEFAAWRDAFEGGKPTPKLKPGEKLIGFYAGPTNRLTAAILLPGEKTNVNWKDALAWAKEQGGDLPNRVEALLLFQHHSDEFQRELYWTNEQRAEGSSFAWNQSFDYGDQDGWHQDFKIMARAVRRVAI